MAHSSAWTMRVAGHGASARDLSAGIGCSKARSQWPIASTPTRLNNVGATGEATTVSAALDQRYYEVVKPSSVGERLFIEARDRIYQDFLDRMQPAESSRILDVGVSDNLSVAANVLERKYQYRQNITACGIEECAEFQSAFPDIRYVQIEPNARLPFADK